MQPNACTPANCSPSRNSKTRWQILLRISTGPRRGIRRTALMPGSWAFSELLVEPMPGEGLYMSFTASRRKPPRSPASHNLLKPCPSLARWSGSKRRRRKDELLRPDLGLRTRIHHASTSQLAAALPHTLSDLPTPNYTTAGVRKGPGGTTLWKRSGCWHSPMG